MKTIYLKCEVPDYTDNDKFIACLHQDYEGNYEQFILPTEAEIKNGREKPVRATGDNYPGNCKGLKAAKRDAAAAIKHLREKGNIKVKR